MISPSDDRDLAARFARLRREEQKLASAFTRLAARRGRKPSNRAPFLVGLAAAAVATVIAAGVLVIRTDSRLRAPREAPPAVGVRPARWTAPTDFLLDVPGDWLLRDLPRVAAPAALRFDIITYRRISS